MNYWPLLLLFIGGVVLTIGDIVMKKWVAMSNAWFYVIGLVIYLAGLNFLAQSFKYENMAIASMIFVIFNVVTLAMVSWIYFKERLSFFGVVGIVLGIASIIVLEVWA